MMKRILFLLILAAFFGCTTHAQVEWKPIEEVAQKFGIPVLAKIPIDPLTAKAMDEGLIEFSKIPEIDTDSLF